jgi:hypothetical protein
MEAILWVMPTGGLGGHYRTPLVPSKHLRGGITAGDMQAAGNGSRRSYWLLIFHAPPRHES